MPGIKRNYPRYVSIVSFMEFRNERWRKSKERADDGNSLNSHPPRRPIHVNGIRVGVRIYFIAIFIPFTKTSRQNCLVKYFTIPSIRAPAARMRRMLRTKGISKAIGVIRGRAYFRHGSE